jgi:hypothetical protein
MFNKAAQQIVLHNQILTGLQAFTIMLQIITVVLPKAGHPLKQN